MKKRSHESDVDLIEALRGSERNAELAFVEVYSRYAHRTYAFIIRMTGDRILSQDLLQETFIRFFRACKNEVIFHNIGAFLLMVARNLCLNWKRDNQETFALEDAFPAPTDHSVEDNELLHLITAALELLDFEYREAFILKYYQGYSYQEMSVITSSSVPALKNRVWRAKEQIRSALKSHIKELQK